MIVFPIFYFMALFFMVDTTSEDFLTAVDDMQAPFPDYTFVSNPPGYLYNATSTGLIRAQGLINVGEIIASPELQEMCITETYCFEFDLELLFVSLVVLVIFVIGLAIKMIPWIIQLIEAVVPF